jgi:O-succinylbenzoate synthase
VEPFRISSGAVAEKDGIVVRVETEDFAGHGEASPMSGNFYSSDTPESCWRDLREQLVPAVLGRSFDTALHASGEIHALPGSNFAKAGLETAFWDIEAQLHDAPLWQRLGGTPKPVASGLAVGLYDDVNDLLRTVERYLADGYKRVKVKIERGRDVELIRAVRRTFGDIPLFVDANGAYDLSDLPVFQALDDFGLMMFEQPFPGRMLRELAELQKQVRTPVCLDESLETVEDLSEAMTLGSLRIANIKLQRVGGFGPALAIYDMCRQGGVPVWMGTMPELGIGQAQGMHFGTLSHCQFPTDVEASLRWFRDDIIDPLLEVKDGCLYPPNRPGLGFEVSQGKLDTYAIATETFRSAA